jgi:hypothetical protein
MNGLRELIRGPGGKAVAIIAVILCLSGAAWSIWSNMSPPGAVTSANDPWFVDAETGKAFHVKLKVGMSIPVKSPFTGHMTGYPAELCYWTKDGHVKKDPTPVLLNSEIGKPGPTFCPDCGRLVVAHNPPAREGETPPPTRAQWEAMHHQQ